MNDRISIRPAGGTWVVRAGGAIIGESSDALMLNAGGTPFVIYFPRGDIAMDFLDETGTVTETKQGPARHYSVVTESATLKDAAWSHEAPLETVAALRGHIAFYSTDEVQVEQI